MLNLKVYNPQEIALKWVSKLLERILIPFTMLVNTTSSQNFEPPKKKKIESQRLP